MSREQVRFHLWINASATLKANLAANPNLMRSYSSYSHWCYTDLLSKENRARLHQMMKPEFPFDTFVEGVGFKVIHPSAKKSNKNPDVIYTIDGVRKRTHRKESDNEERETMLLRRVSAKTLQHPWLNNVWNSKTMQYDPVPKAQAFCTYMKQYDAGEVFVDRVTKKEKDKLMMINLLDPGVYLEGFGGYKMVKVWDYNTRQYNDTEKRQYFIEV